MIKRLDFLVLMITACVMTFTISACGGDDDIIENNQQSPTPTDGYPGEGYVKVTCSSCDASGKCYRCQGSGKYCYKCSGSGNCVECNGSLICAKCNGDSCRTCEKCSGSGNCKYCGGSAKCYQCDGVGQVDYGYYSHYREECALCRGSGRCLQCTGGKCGNCKGTGIWKCGFCGGDGTCHTCYGSGLCEICEGNPPHCYVCLNGDGKCATCEGKGYTWEYRPNANIEDEDVPSENGGGSSSDTKRKCVICGGSGRCDNVTMLYTTRKYYCLGSGRCQWCNGSGQIRSVTGDWIRCVNCNGKLNADYGDGKCGKCGGSGKCKNCGGDGYK